MKYIDRTYPSELRTRSLHLRWMEFYWHSGKVRGNIPSPWFSFRRNQGDLWIGRLVIAWRNFYV